MGPVKGRDADQADLRLRLSASLDEARRELIDATERGEGGRAARLAGFSERIDRIVCELVESARGADRYCGRRVRDRRLRSPIAVSALGHRSADRLWRGDRPAAGALRQGAAASAMGPAVPGRASRSRDRRFRSSRHRKPGISAGADGPAPARRRPRPPRSSRCGGQTPRRANGARRFSRRSWR